MEAAADNDSSPEPAKPPAVSVVPKEEPSAGPSNASLAGARRFDFRQPAFISAGEMRRLKAGCAEFAAAAASRLTQFLQSEVDMKLASVAPEAFKTFVAALPSPTHLVLFRMEPLRGTCLLQMDVNLGVLLADRLLGGAATAPEEGRELGELEATLLDQVVTLITETWCAQWAAWQKTQPVLLGHENEGRYLTCCAPETHVLTVKVEVKLGEVSGALQLVFPFRTLDPLFRHLRQQLRTSGETTTESRAGQPVRWDPRYEDLPVAITARFPSFQVPARRVSQLSVGEVLNLPADFASRVQMSLAGLNRLTGRLGTREGHWAVEVLNLGRTQP